MLATPIQLRAPHSPVNLETNLLLAPIAGWCDLAWRTTCRSLGGVGLACTDLLSPQGLLCGSEASADLAKTNEHDKPIGMQLYGSHPQTLADGARWCVEHGATVVDINMGCPVDKVCKKDGGSKLMCNLPNTFEIFEAVRAALPPHVPLTAKMRLGWNEQDYDQGVASTLACGLADRGAALITVHGRTTEQRFKGTCRLEGIRRVVQDVAAHTGPYDGTTQGGVPVVGNGDVRTPEDVITMLSQTGCAGVMIGRGAFAGPWIFRTAWAAQQALQASGINLTDNPTHTTHHQLIAAAVHAAEPDEDTKLDAVRHYITEMAHHRSDQYALHKIRQKISWLGKGINNSHCKPLKDAVRKADSVTQALDAIEQWRQGRPEHSEARPPETVAAKTTA